eukprot:CAMPEP_0174262318 /NCGR_PEP_ID=MMETSP0439-20130205/12905_1 /TAXON_ID=0 /ORGANISM="Stereomyxa ramosa, Strain Chinc5" /LENGTH=285 /DNA_ID=CAMNT_0015347009 /DNA_START=237 /DNA_END=1094 /DNA_ORIENTATION=-
MEDRHVAVKQLPNHPQMSFFGIFDGHGGQEASYFVSHRLYQIIDQNLLLMKQKKVQNEEKPVLHRSDKEKAICAAFETVDNEFKFSTFSESGTTAICALVDKQTEDVLIVNLGDSRAILGGQEFCSPLSRDHKPDNKEELERIENAGSMVRWGRVNGMLAVSRAFGDFQFKENYNIPPGDQAVTYIPEFVHMSLQNTNQEFLVLACDGLWDVMTNKEVTRFVNEQLKSRIQQSKNNMEELRGMGMEDKKEELGCAPQLHLIAQDLAEHAVAIGSTDNVSVCLVLL